MEKLRIYLNGLPPPAQVEFALRCGTTVGYLRKVLSTGAPLREKLCAVIERMSAGAVTRRDLRPDDWQSIWPELADSAPNHPPALTPQAQAATESVAQGVAHA